MRKSATDALGEALRMQGFSVVLFEEAQKSLPRGEGCDQACGERLLKLVAADLSAVVKVSGNTEHLPTQTQVTLVDAAGHHYEGSAKLRDGDVREATTRALFGGAVLSAARAGPVAERGRHAEGAEVR